MRTHATIALNLSFPYFGTKGRNFLKKKKSCWLSPSTTFSEGLSLSLSFPGSKIKLRERESKRGDEERRGRMRESKKEGLNFFCALLEGPDVCGTRRGQRRKGH